MISDTKKMIYKFFTFGLAEKVAEEKNSAINGVYYLNHGEYARPTYSVVKYRDGYAVKVSYFYYRGTFYAPKNHLLTSDEV